MSNFGVKQLRVVNPYELAFREARSAVNASEILKQAQEYNDVAKAIADCHLVIGTTAAQNRELQHLLYDVREAAPLIRQHLISGKVAILFGSEKRGLSNHDFSYCQWLMHIPTLDQHLSMNLGQAVAVCLYELSREQQAAPVAGTPAATAGELDLLTSALLESLQLSGYLKPRTGAVTQEKIRRLVRRLSLTGADAETLLGVFRQVTWKMKNPGNDSND